MPALSNSSGSLNLEDNIMIATDAGQGRDLNVTLIDYGIVKTCGHKDKSVQETCSMFRS